MLDRDIKSLIKILEESNIEEMEITTFWGKQKIRLRKNTNKNIHPAPLSNKNSEDIIIDNKFAELKKDDINTENEIVNNSDTQNISIKAPLVGTFYLSPKPDEPPFVKEGDIIKQGQTICIIEAMKIFNEIESEYSGKVLKILHDNATPVEFDQDLFIISSK